MMNKFRLFGNYFPFLFSAIILFIHYLPELINPIFPGDSGFRLLHANHVVLLGGSSVWLPFLQLHVFLLYLLKSPVFLYKFIPIFYFLLVLFMINKLSLKIIGNGILEILFTTLLLLALTNNSLLLYLGSNLYQEIIVFALLYVLIYLYYFGKTHRFLFYIFAFLALLTREYFWIYYITLGIISLFRINTLTRNKIIIYCLYGLIPLLWIFYTKQPVFLKTFSANSYLNAQVIIDRTYRLIEVFTTNHLPPIILILFITFCFVYIGGKFNNIKDSNHYFIDYHIFSLISLLGMYLFIILLDPWQPIPLNARIVFPIFIHLPFWFLICYKYASRLPRHSQIIIMLLLVFGLGTLVNKRPHLQGLFIKQSSFYREIPEAISIYKNQSHIRSLKIAIVSIDYWKYYIAYLTGPLLYANNRYESKYSCLNYDIIISYADYFADNFYRYKTINIADNVDIYMWFKK